MSKTTPIRERNAIDEIAFVILFEKELNDETLSKLTVLEEELASDLPDFEMSNVLQVVFNPQSPRMPVSKPGGVVCSKKVDNKSPRMEWSVRVQADNIIVACSEYTNWEDIWTKAKGFLFAALDKFDIEENPIVEIVFQCVDKFIFNEDVSKYQVSEVFNLESGYLTRNITSNNPDSWHIYQGWFEFFDNGARRALHNLNLNAYKQNEDQPHETAISHLVKIRMTDGSPINDATVLRGNDREIGYLESVMETSHKSNKDVLLNLLSDDMVNKIGLKD